MKNTHFVKLDGKKHVFFFIFCVTIANSYYMNSEQVMSTNAQVTYSYDRINDVKKECAKILDSAPVLKPDVNRMYSIKEELSFVNGDWWQVSSNEHPIMPFDTREIVNSSLGAPSPLKVASFWVADVEKSRSLKKYISVSGVMQMGISLGGLYDQKPYAGSPRFDIWPGQSTLTVTFQGVYTETKDDERVMCLLGEAMLPYRHVDASDPWEWVRESGFANNPQLLQDEQILLVIRYPKTFSLPNRAIRGSMSSLHKKMDIKYFDEVHISSWPAASASYEFGSKNVVLEACSPSNEDALMGNDVEMYKGFDLCSILQRITQGEGITVVPNWKCNGTDEFCRKLGPFSSDKMINCTDGGFKDVKLVLQDVRCKRETLGNGQISKVSSVFRVVDPSENWYNATQRTGLSNTTLSAEGQWNHTSGKLCMIGCLGLSTDCSSRVVLYIPLSFSIKQRSIIMGTISSIKKTNSSYFPLSFEMIVRNMQLLNQYTTGQPYYKYSKINSAAVVLEKDEPFSVGTVIKKSFLQYPKMGTKEAFSVSLSYLAEDLTLHTAAYPYPVPSSRPPRSDVRLEIVSVGPLFGHYWSSQNGTSFDKETQFKNRPEYTEEQLLLNISAQLTLSDNNLTLFLEGLYDEHVGKMYLIGCRDVRASWKVLYDSMDVEAGLDCLVEAVITYPPTTARWLVSPTASISISSQRNGDDPLYFKPIKLQTFPLMYRRQREDILSRRGIEGILRIITLSVAIVCILSQVFYIRDTLESVPFISLVMLGVQAIEYSIPLITGAETLFKRMESESYENESYNLNKNQWLQVIDYTVKLLVLVSFLVTIRLCQKVWKSRVRLLTRAPLEPHRVPSDKMVLIITSVIHIVGYIIVLCVHFLRSSQRLPRMQTFVRFDGNSQTVREWVTELEEYMGLIQDFFLLPQIIGNFIWQIDSKPVRKFYYLGLTSVRLLPHIYDFIKSPITNPYFSEEYEFVNPRYDFYSKFGDVAIPVTGIILAAIVYVQQRWKYDKLRETITIGNRKLLPLGSKVYERLPSQSFEAELVSGASNGDTHRKENEDSDWLGRIG